MHLNIIETCEVIICFWKWNKGCLFLAMLWQGNVEKDEIIHTHSLQCNPLFILKASQNKPVGLIEKSRKKMKRKKWLGDLCSVKMSRLSLFFNKYFIPLFKFDIVLQSHNVKILLEHWENLIYSTSSISFPFCDHQPQICNDLQSSDFQLVCRGTLVWFAARILKTCNTWLPLP